MVRIGEPCREYIREPAPHPVEPFEEPLGDPADPFEDPAEEPIEPVPEKVPVGPDGEPIPDKELGRGQGGWYPGPAANAVPR